MARNLDVLKEKNLIDNREIWAQGKVHTFKRSGAPKGFNARFFSVKDDELYALKLMGPDVIVLEKYSKKNVKTVNVKSELFGFFKVIEIELINGQKHTYDITKNKAAIPEIIDIIK